MLVFSFWLLLTQLGLQQYCFLVFLAICIGVATYIYLVIPETKNKTFLEIQDEFGSRKKQNAPSADGVRKILLSTSVWTESIQEQSMLCLPVFSSETCVFVTPTYLLSTSGRLCSTVIDVDEWNPWCSASLHSHCNIQLYLITCILNLKMCLFTMYFGKKKLISGDF